MRWKTSDCHRGNIDAPVASTATRPTTITTLNVAGFLSIVEKQRQAGTVLSGHDAQGPADIALLQEVKVSHRQDTTHLAHGPVTALSADDCQQLASNVNPGGRSWWTPYCAIILAPHTDSTPATVQEALDGRVLCLSYEDLTIVNIYSPANGAERKRFFVQLTEVLALLPGTNDNLLVAGDWNLVPDPAQVFDWLHGNPQRRDVGRPELESLLEELGQNTRGALVSNQNGDDNEHDIDPASHTFVEVMQALGITRSVNDYTYYSSPQATRNGEVRLRRLDWFATSPHLLQRIDPSSIKTSTQWLTGGDHAAVTIRIGGQISAPEGGEFTRKVAIVPGIAALGTFYDSVSRMLDTAIADTDAADDDTVKSTIDQLATAIHEQYGVHAKAERTGRHANTKQALARMAKLMDTHPDPRRWDDVFDRTRKEIQNDIAACVESSVAVNSAVADIDFRQDGHADRKVYLRRATTYLPTIFTSQRIYVPDLHDEHDITPIRDPALRSEILGVHASQEPRPQTEATFRSHGWTSPKFVPTFADVPDNGSGYTDTTTGMLANVSNFYTALYRENWIHEAALRKVLAHLPARNRLPPEAIAALGAPVTVAEVLAAIKALKNGKACGPDGLCAELLKRHAEQWAILLTRLFNAAFQSGVGSHTMVTGLISLLQKGGDPRELGNVRPITLVSKIMSTLAELWKTRLRPYLPLTTGPDQCSAAPGRFMYEAIFRVLDSIEHAHAKQLPMAMLMLDARKAFDLLDRNYLREVLLHLCGHKRDESHRETNMDGTLSPAGKVMRWLDVLLGTRECPHERAVMVNGFLTPPQAPVLLRSGTPQGLEVSAQLYNMGGEGLMGLIAAVGIEGIIIDINRRSDRHLPVLRPTRLIAARYADDFVGLVMLEHLHLLLDCIDIYCAATGQDSNNVKTLAFGIGLHATVDAAWAALGRVTWCKPADACGKALGIMAGPGADSRQQWAKIATAMFNKIRQWQNQPLSYRARTQGVLQTYVWSLALFMGSYIPPPAQLHKVLDAATRQYAWKGRLSDGTTPQSALGDFPHSSRHCPQKLANPTCHGGIGWTPSALRLDAVHAMWIVEFLADKRANSIDPEAFTWYDIGADMVATLHDVAEAVDGAVAVQLREYLLVNPVLPRRRQLSERWQTYLAAWSRLRRTLVVAPPSTHEQVLAVPLFHNPTLHHGLDTRSRHAWARRGVTHIRHLWSTRHRQWATAEALQVTTDSLLQVQRRLPLAWVALLHAGDTNFAAGQWVLAPTTGLPERYQHQAAGGRPGHILARIDNRLHDVAVQVTVHTCIPATGWRADGVHIMDIAGLIHATVEDESRATDGGGRIHWLTGATAETFYASRNSIHWRSEHGTLRPISHITQSQIRRLITGPTQMAASATAILTAVQTPQHIDLDRAFLTMHDAPWPSLTRNFAYDLASGALPCGKAHTGVTMSECPFCLTRAANPPRDTVQHIVCDCPYLEPLRLLLTRLWSCLYPDTRTPPLLSLFLAYGHVGSTHDHAAATAIRGALLAATRWARISITSEAGAVNPAALTNAALSNLRTHIHLDWRATTPAVRALLAARPSQTQRAIRPNTQRAFVLRWSRVATYRNDRVDFIGPLALRRAGRSGRGNRRHSTASPT